MYCDNVLDVIAVATARALKLNLTIYHTELKGNIKNSQAYYTCKRQKCSLEIYICP